MAEYQFQTEVNQLLKLIIHSMYSNKDIFLREIVSNASDALDKLNYLKVSDEAYKGVKSEPRIDITFDDPNKIYEKLTTRAIEFEGISFTTTLPAPMVTLSPIVTPGRMVTLPPIHTLSPMRTDLDHSRRLLRSTGLVL